MLRIKYNNTVKGERVVRLIVHSTKCEFEFERWVRYLHWPAARRSGCVPPHFPMQAERRALTCIRSQIAVLYASRKVPPILSSVLVCCCYYCYLFVTLLFVTLLSCYLASFVSPPSRPSRLCCCACTREIRSWVLVVEDTRITVGYPVIDLSEEGRKIAEAKPAGAFRISHE